MLTCSLKRGCAENCTATLPGMCFSPRRAKVPTLPAWGHSSYWGRSCQGWGWSLAVAHRRSSKWKQLESGRGSHRWHLHRQCTSSSSNLSEARPPSPIPQPLPGFHTGPCSKAPHQGEGSGGQGESSDVRDKGGSDLKHCLDRVGQSLWMIIQAALQK